MYEARVSECQWNGCRWCVQLAGHCILFTRKEQITPIHVPPHDYSTLWVCTKAKLNSREIVKFGVLNDSFRNRYLSQSVDNSQWGESNFRKVWIHGFGNATHSKQIFWASSRIIGHQLPSLLWLSVKPDDIVWRWSRPLPLDRANKATESSLNSPSGSGSRWTKTDCTSEAPAKATFGSLTPWADNGHADVEETCPHVVKHSLAPLRTPLAHRRRRAHTF